MTAAAADLSLRPITDARLETGAMGLAHGFFTRQGGVSKGPYGDLNTGLGSQDDSRAVAENRRRIAAHFGLPASALTTVHQQHTSDVVSVTEPLPIDGRPVADAMVTDRAGIILAVLTADCGPVLFADQRAGIIGAAHAGWRGAMAGVLENTIIAMETLGADRAAITAVLGPTISQPNYEVGPEFVAALEGASAENSRFFAPSEKPGHAQFDLPGYILARLTAAGVDAQWTGHCTYADETRFFSYRRATHRREPDYGRALSAIVRRA